MHRVWDEFVADGPRAVDRPLQRACYAGAAICLYPTAALQCVRAAGCTGRHRQAATKK